MLYENCNNQELLAYIELEKQTFDFGEGPMKMKGSEADYYKKALRYNSQIQKNKNEVDDIKNYPYDDVIERKQKARMNYINKQKSKQRIAELANISWCLAYTKDDYMKRVYRGSRSKFLKKESNKLVRKSKNLVSGSDYRKVYPFWHNLY